MGLREEVHMGWELFRLGHLEVTMAHSRVGGDVDRASEDKPGWETGPEHGHEGNWSLWEQLTGNGAQSSS